MFSKRENQNEGRFGVLCRFQQLRTYCDKIETQNWEEIPFSLRLVPRVSLSCRRTICVATRPTRFLGGPSRDSNLRNQAWEPGVITTTRPWRIPLEGNQLSIVYWMILTCGFINLDINAHRTWKLLYIGMFVCILVRILGALLCQRY